MKVLVLYATVEGQTKKIAKTLSEEFEAKSLEVDLTAVSDPGYCEPGTYDAAILCAPIHMGRYPSEFVDYINNWKSSLIGVPTALVTTSLAIASDRADEKEEAEGYPKKLIKKTGWVPTETYNVAGALKYLEYNFFKRWILKRIAQSEGEPTDTSKDHELTDWKALKAFAHNFIKNHIK